MKRVLTALLLIALVVTCFAFASCGGEGEAHVHTFKDTWSKDASGHWYDATCECTEDLRVVLAHVDNNNDGACDICTYTDHEHTYSEDYTADCTNHWNAADCGHTVAGANVEAHIDETGDGVCDVCKYVIEDLHEHIYATEWDGDGEYHWHNAICEHKVEVSDKEAHEINDAGYCTVCNKQIKEVDKTDILAVLKAAVANNYKVVTGTVIADEMVYGAGATLETGKTNKVFFILGNGDSYVEWGSYNMAGEFIGVDEYYQETLENGTIFAVQIPYYDGSERNDELKMFPASGDPMKLSGYNYTPGAILASYNDTATLAQTIANLYDILVMNVNVSNPQSGYDAETGKYTFSYGFFSVNETKGSTSLDGSGEDVVSYYVEYYDVKVEFTVDENLVINNATFSVDSYRNLEGVDEDIEYDPVENKVTFLPGKSATTYTYTVAQTSGERTYTTIYPKASLIPQGFELLTGTPVKDPDTLSTIGFTDKKPLGDKLVISNKVYTYIVLGDPYPITSSFSFLNTEDISVSWVNNTQGSSGEMATIDPYFSWSAGYIAFFPKDDGSYTLTIRIGDVTKSIIVEIGEADLVAPDDTADTKYVVVKDPNGWDAEYTYEAKESGKYTFTIPANLGFVVENAQTPVADPFDPLYDAREYTYEFELAKGEKLTFNVGAKEKGVFAIGVAFVASEVVGPGEGGEGGDNPPAGEIDIIGTYTNGADLTVIIDETNATFKTSKYQTVARYEISNGQVVLYNDANESIWQSSILAINLKDGKVTSIVYNGNKYNVTPASEGGEEEPDETNGTGTEDDPYVITAGDYVAPFKGGSDLVYYSFTATEGGFVTLKSTFDGTPWLYLGAVSNEGEADTLTAYVPAGGTIIMQVGDWDEQADDVPFTVSFEAKASDDFSALVGTWYGDSGFGDIYTLVINEDGKGTIEYATSWGTSNYDVTYVFVDGTIVTIGYSGNNRNGAIDCTYDGTTFACTNALAMDSFIFQTTPIENEGGEGGEGGEEPPVFEEDPIKESICGEYTDILEGYTFNIYNSWSEDGYLINVFKTNDAGLYEVDLYFSFDVIENDDGTYSLTLAYVNKSYEAGSEKVDEILATSVVITPKVLSPIDALINAESTLNGNTACFGFDMDEGCYFLNVYNYDVQPIVDLYYKVEATENENGTVSLVLTFWEDHWMYTGVVTDEYELDGKTVIATLVDNSWTFAVEGAEEPEVPEEGPDGTFANPYELQENNSCNFPGGNSYLFYKYTAKIDGTLTITVTSTDFYWGYGAAEFELDNVGTTPTADIALKAGDVVYIGMATNSYGAGVVEFTATFKAADEVEPEEPEVPQGPDGTFANPYELQENNSCDFPGGYNYLFYKYTANEDGTLTITVTGADFYWGYGAGEYSLNNVGKIPTADIALKAGDVVYIGMSTNSASAGVVEFTATFTKGESEDPEVPQEPDGTSGNPFAIVIGENSLVYQGYAYGWAYYQYTATEDGTLVITMTSDNYDLGYGPASTQITGTQSSPLSIKLNADETVWVGISSKTGAASETPITFTASFGSGAVEEPKDNELVLGNNAVNATDITYVYNATEDIIIRLEVTTAVMGTVTVKYSINDGEAVAIVNGSPKEVTLKSGDKLTVTAETTSGYLTIKASEVVVKTPVYDTVIVEGTTYIWISTEEKDNDSAMREMVVERDGVYSIATSSLLVNAVIDSNGNAVTKNTDHTYNLPAGNYLVIFQNFKNFGVQADVEYECNLNYKGEIVVPEEPEDPEEPEVGGDTTDVSGTYVGANASGRGMQVVIDTAADTMVITRASSSTGSFDGQTSYTYCYSETVANVAAGNAVSTVNGGWSPISGITFDANGLITSLAWQGSPYTNYVKQ